MKVKTIPLSDAKELTHNCVRNKYLHVTCQAPVLRDCSEQSRCQWPIPRLHIPVLNSGAQTAHTTLASQLYSTALKSRAPEREYNTLLMFPSTVAQFANIGWMQYAGSAACPGEATGRRRAQQSSVWNVPMCPRQRVDALICWYVWQTRVR